MYKKILLGLFILILVVGVRYAWKSTKKHQVISHQLSQYIKTTSIPKFSHVFVIVFENHSYSQIIGNPSAPYINQLAHQYGLATNFSALAHPSLPNYLALTAGSTFDVTSDCGESCFQNTPANIFSELEAAGKTWKSYHESMPSNCF